MFSFLHKNKASNKKQRDTSSLSSNGRIGMTTSATVSPIITTPTKEDEKLLSNSKQFPSDNNLKYDSDSISNDTLLLSNDTACDSEVGKFSTLSSRFRHSKLKNLSSVSPFSRANRNNLSFGSGYFTTGREPKKRPSLGTKFKTYHCSFHFYF
jgi:outer membrane receptor for ferrienterochelin and colicin